MVVADRMTLIIPSIMLLAYKANMSMIERPCMYGAALGDWLVWFRLSLPISHFGFYTFNCVFYSNIQVIRYIGMALYM